MKSSTIVCRQACLAALLWFTGAAGAMPVPFAAVFEGQSDIVGIVDPAGPVVQVQTVAAGSGVFGLVSYFSADQINLATGQGAGANRFVADDGSELFGAFTVQLVPTADPAVMEIFGLVDFTGGVGRFAGADGEASFSGVGRFISPTTALTRFDFRGNLNLVPEPAAGLLALLGAGMLLRRRIRH